jgi:glutamate--cysteine ligase
LAQLARKFDFFDPWYFSARSVTVKDVDFESDAGLKVIADRVSEMLATLKSDYAARGIQETPHVFVKNDAGTYGMGVFSVRSPDEILEASRKLRQKMRKGKESVPISQIIIQEAVPTALTYRVNADDPATTVAGEPALYLINGIPIGGFIRLHESLGENARWENLNQPGSKLEPLECPKNPGHSTRPFAKPRGANPCEQIAPRETYGFLARLHAIAAGLEECPE